MKVRWDTEATEEENQEFKRRLELRQIKRQIEVLSTFLPGSILNIPKKNRFEDLVFTGVVLMIDIAGCSRLCEKYNKTDGGGIHRLTNTLNAYFGAIIEAVHLFGGDVLHYTFSGYQCIWTANVGDCLYDMLHNVIVCAVYIRDAIGSFETEVNATLRIKLTMSCGHLRLVISGNDQFKRYLLLGECITEIKKVRAEENMVVLNPSAWGHVQEDAYDFEFLPDGTVKLLRYQDRLAHMQDVYTKKLEQAAFMCGKHLEHRQILHQLRKFDDTLTDFKITQNFMQDLPVRTPVANAAHDWTTNELKPFVISVISHQVEEKLAVDYLTEMREITVLQINVVPVGYGEDTLLECIRECIETVTKCVSDYLGHIIGFNIFAENIRIICSFGLRGVKHELESRNALRGANRIMMALRGSHSVGNVFITVTIDYIYCGVLGHPRRRDYCLIGRTLYQYSHLIEEYPNQIICDLPTFKNAKLTSSYFSIISSTIGDIVHTLFKYDEFLEYEPQNLMENSRILGRTNVLDFINHLVHQPHKIGHFSGVCLKGPHDIGVSKIIRAALRRYPEDEYTVAAVELIGKQRAYYTVSIIYKQIYNKYAEADSTNVSIIKNMPRDLWNFNEILQQDGKRNHQLYSERKYQILNLFKAICKGDSTLITLVFIDNVQYIDNKSFDVLHVALEEKVIRLICGGCFEQTHWDTLWKFSLSNQIKIMELTPLQEQYVAPLLCQLLNVKGVSKKLVSLMITTCEGKPGYIAKSTLRLLSTYSIEIQHIPEEKLLEMNEIIVPNDLSSDESQDDDDLAIERLFRMKSKIYSIGIFTDSELKFGNFNMDAIIYEEYSTFSSYQQLVIKSASVLGESFSRQTLVLVLKHPHEQLFANTIKSLFEEHVFDCGTKYINTPYQEIKPLICHCFETAAEIEQNFGLPKYAYCKFIYFKHTTLRNFAFNLVPPHHRKEVHLKATEILESQNHLCPYCMQDGSGSMLVLRKFAEVAAACNTGDVPVGKNKVEDITDETLKDWIRNVILYDDGTLTDNLVVKRRIWDSSACYCLEILTKVYADLVYHSKSADHVGRIIFFLISYAILMNILEDYENSIPLLTEASELCMFNSQMQYITDEFKRFCLAKAHIMLTEAHLNLDNLVIAQNHICIALRQFDVPMISMLYRSINSIMTISFLNHSNHVVKMPKWVSFTKVDFSICMNLVGIILYRKGYYKNAKRAIMKSLAFARTFNTNVTFLCEAYCTAIELYSFCGDMHVCEQLESNINMEILKFYAHRCTFELIGICKLLFLLFQCRAMSGKILETIKFGYRTIEINLMCQCYRMLMDLLPVLCSLLLLSKRIPDAVQLAIMLCGYSSKFDQWAFIGYFAFCMELALECSLFLEPIEKVVQFASIYYVKQEKSVRSKIDNKLILLIVNYYARNAQLTLSTKWMEFHQPSHDASFSFISVGNLLKRYENTLIIIAMCFKYHHENRHIYENHAEELYKECALAAKKWKIFKPRFLHLKAYHQLLNRNKIVAHRTLGKGLKEARKQENILEQCWILQDQTAWKAKYTSDLVEYKQYSWTLASRYSPLHWSQLIDLPTFRNAKLTSSYFFIISSTIGDIVHTLFKYDEFLEYEPQNLMENSKILGRTNVLDFINHLVHQPHKIGHFSGVCLKGPHDIGVSKIIRAALRRYPEDEYTVAAVELIGKQRAYYTVSIIYKQIYNKYAEADSTNVSTIKNMPRDLWNFNEILQQDGKRNHQLYSERKYQILNLFKAICKGDSTLITLVFIDNVQYIDNKSFDVLHVALEEKVIRLICGGCFEQTHWDTLWKFSLSNQIKIMELTPLQEQYVAPLLCQLLNVKGVSKKLVSLMITTCEGKPGYIAKSTLRLLSTYSIEIQHIPEEKLLEMNEIIVPNDLSSDESQDDDDLAIERLFRMKSKIYSIGIFTDSELKFGNFNMDAIIYEEYSTFSSYQQLVIKSASVLGESFSRQTLVLVLKHPHEQLFANTIKSLFEEHVFDCGTKYINTPYQEIKPLICHCFETAAEIEQNFGLPKYAYCKFIYFKHTTLRNFAFNLVPPHHRKEVHLKATEILESQNHLCPYCMQDGSGSMLVLRKFAEVAAACNTGDVPVGKNKVEDITDETLKDWIRNVILYDDGTLTDNLVVKRRIWDSSACYCLEILTKVYADLVYHSKSADHVGRIIFFLISYAILMNILEDYENSIPLLTEASELCMFNSQMQYITDEFKRFCLAKAHIMLTEAHLNLDNLVIAQNHICIALRQFDVPMISMLYRSINSIMTISFLNHSNHVVKMPKWVSFTKVDFSICMNLVGIILYRKGYYKNAKRAIMKSLAFARTFNTNVTFLCEAYCTAIELYSFCGDMHVCEQLESNINMEILKFYAHRCTFELIGICKLLFLLFQCRAMSGKILETIKFGYRTIEINLMCQCYRMLMDLLPVLCSLLLLSKRIPDAVQLAIMLCGYSSKFDQWAFIGYFAFCMELALECSLFLEPIEKVVQFASIYYVKQEKSVRSKIDNKLILLIVNYYARNAQLTLSTKWMEFHQPSHDASFSFISVGNLLKRYENTLIIIAMCFKYHHENRHIYENHAEELYKECALAAKKWKIFKPRFLHLKAYHQLLNRNKIVAHRTLGKGLKEARKQENILEQCWILQDQTAWKAKYTSDLVEYKQYSWTLASRYSPLHWSQVMYALPLYF